MADENAEKEAAAAKAAADQKAADEAAAAEKQKTVPHEALHAEREKRKAAEAELEKLRKDATDKAAAEAAEKGEFKTLYETEKAAREAAEAKLKESVDKLTGIETSQAESNQKMLEAVKDPEDLKTVEKLLEGKSELEKAALLPKLLEKFGVDATINKSLNGGGGPKDKTTAQLDTEIAELEKQYADAKTNKDPTAMMEISRKLRDKKDQKDA